MISLGATARAGLIAAMLFGAVQARAAEPAPVLNPAPTAQDWAAIAALRRIRKERMISATPATMA